MSDKSASSPVLDFSAALADLIRAAAPSLVSVQSNRARSTGFSWRPGLIVAAENTPDNRVSAGERYAAVYEINLSRCIFCGYCEIACPFDAITMGTDFEMSDYERPDLIFTKEMLLAEPFERAPLRREGE